MGLIATAKSKPKENFEEFLTLIYGKQKIGKSSFCSGLNDPYFLDTENGLNNLDVFKTDIDSWETFKEVYKEFKAKKGKLPFKTLVIDTIDNLWQMCCDYICQQQKINHESELEWGKGYAMIQREFNVALAAYRSLGMGLIYTSHVSEEEIATRIGKYTHFGPSMQRGCAKQILPSVDFILYATSIDDEKGEEKRVLYTKPSKYWEAGDRIGKLPEVMPLDAKAFMEAFKKAKESK